MLTGLGLLDLFTLLDDVNNIAKPVRLAFSVCVAGLEEDVVDSVDALRWTGDKSALGLLQPAGA